MRLFIKKLVLFSIIISTLILSAYLVMDVLGWSDWAYKRFTSSGEKSLILGTSRAAQGIHPEIINIEFKGKNFELPIYNFSFTATASPYGEVYYNAIKKKLSGNRSEKGLFILSVDPLCLAMTSEDTESELREETDRLRGITIYMKPNIQYFWKYAKPLSFDNNGMRLHDDGWLEVNAPMDSVSVHERVEGKKKEYLNVTIKKSIYRIEWLEKIIDLLKTRGKVYLVRIPASNYFFDFEERFWISFEEDMNEIARGKKVDYISFKDALDRYQTTDGNHLYKTDGERFTKDLCDSIKCRQATCKIDI